MARKRDIKQIEAIAREFNMNAEQRGRGFSSSTPAEVSSARH